MKCASDNQLDPPPLPIEGIGRIRRGRRGRRGRRLNEDIIRSCAVTTATTVRE